MEHSHAATFVFVHSAWLGGWAWDGVARQLEAEGHKVFTPDLPGHGQDRTPPAAVTMNRATGYGLLATGLRKTCASPGQPVVRSP